MDIRESCVNIIAMIFCLPMAMTMLLLAFVVASIQEGLLTLFQK